MGLCPSSKTLMGASVVVNFEVNSLLNLSFDGSCLCHLTTSLACSQSSTALRGREIGGTSSDLLVGRRYDPAGIDVVRLNENVRLTRGLVEPAPFIEKTIVSFSEEIGSTTGQQSIEVLHGLVRLQRHGSHSPFRF